MSRSLLCSFVLALAALAGPSGAIAAPAPAAVADQLAERWATLQQADGGFPDSLRPGSRDWGRYGDAGLGYGLMLAGVRNARADWTEAGARAQLHAIGAAKDRLSVFENLLIASGFNLLAVRAAGTPSFAAQRAAWEQYLREVRPLFNAAIDKPYLSSNKYLVEAVLGLELDRSGLTSDLPGTALYVPGEARRRALDIVNRLVPGRVATLREQAAGHRITALSDRYAQPPAYHALVVGFLARAIDLAGPGARASARRALRIGVRTLWAYQSPDGDVAYLGRSQGQSWAQAFAAFAAERAAGAGCGAQARDFMAVGDRAMGRLAALYPVGPAGMPIVPSANGPATLPALDDYAGDVVYNGLTLTALGWAADGAYLRPGCLPDAVLGERERAAARLPFESARFGVLRSGRVWMAVKQSSQGSDPRAGFGLRALKYRAGDGSWLDLLPAAPRLAGVPATLGPVLVRRRGALALPRGAHIDFGRAGMLVRGGWVSPGGRWLRRGTFRFVPTATGVRMIVPTRKGDRIVYSTLSSGRPVLTGSRLTASAATTRVSDRAAVALQGPFVSSSSLDVWRADLSVRARGRSVAFSIDAPAPAPAAPVAPVAPATG